jgi:DNA-directed RNA polymerase specialized sigma subunit
MKTTRKEIGKLWKFVAGNLKPEEEKLLYLFYKREMQRQQIAKILEINNTTCTYRIDRCVKKLRYEYLITKLLPIVERNLSENEYRVFVLYAQLKNQQKVATFLNITQGAISQRLSKIRKKLSKIKGKEMKEFLSLSSLKLSFWSWENEKKMFSNAMVEGVKNGIHRT